MKIFAPRGTSDILPKDQFLWSKVVSVCKKIATDEWDMIGDLTK